MSDYEQVAQWFARTLADMTKAGAISGWEWPWMHEDLEDGNPVFTAVNRDRGRGVRLIACITGEEQIPEGARRWIDTTGDGVEELVVAFSGRLAHLLHTRRIPHREHAELRRQATSASPRHTPRGGPSPHSRSAASPASQTAAAGTGARCSR